jgi:MBG domain/Kelch motif/Immunoglobulin domain/Immunoglobulin I-set domain/Galactose oxidase, central domain
MFNGFLARLPRALGVSSHRQSRRRRFAWTRLALEALESRDLPAPLTWAPGANLPLAESGIVAQAEGASLLTMAGPGATSYAVSATVPTWKAAYTAAVQPLDFVRSSPGSGPLPGGYYILFGGLENGFATSAVTQYDPNTVTVLDGATNQTRSLRKMNIPRAELGSATDASGLVYAIGGQDNNGTPLATVEVYNPTNNAWTFLAPLPQALYGESAVSDGAGGHIYTFGGVGANGVITNVVYRYTISTNSWDQLAAPLQLGVRDSTAVLGPNGLIYVIAGKTAAGATATVESYNSTTNSWTVENSLPQPLSSAAAEVDSLGRIEVLGGSDANGNPLATVYISQELSQPDLAPTITSTAPTTGYRYRGYSYQVTSTGNPQATYSLTTAPTGMTISSSTGLISWTPTATGSYPVTVQASSPVGQVSQTYSLNVVVPIPLAPTGLTATPASPSGTTLSWTDTDPNITSYSIYQQFYTVSHGAKGSGGGRIYYYTLIASGITTSSYTLNGGGIFSVVAVDSAGHSPYTSALITVPVTPPPPTPHVPDLYVATTTSGTDISGQTLSVGQTGQIILIQEFGNPAPTFSVVSSTEPPSGGVTVVNPTTGLVSYTPTVADIGTQAVQFVATNSAGTSAPYTFYYYVQADNPTLTVAPEAVTYDGNAHASSATAIGTDGLTPVAGGFIYSYSNSTYNSSTPPTDAGTYTVQATFTSADPSYASGTATATLTINPATPTITVNAGPFTYDGVTADAATATAVGVDGVTPVNGSFAFTYDGATTAPIGPGLSVVNAAFTSNDPNYTSPTVTANLIINSTGTVIPNLTLTDGSANYDGNAHADTATAVDPTTLAPVAGSFILTYNGSPTAPTQAGSYAVVASFISSDPNYANASTTGTMTISAVAPTITISSSYPFYYDTFGQAQYVSEVGVDGVTPVNGTLSVLYNGSSALPINAGTYDVSVTFTSNDPNYLSTTADGSMTIQQAGPSLYYYLNGGAYYYYYNGMPQGVNGTALGYFNNPINGTFSYAYYDSTGAQLPGTPTAAGYYTFTEYFTSLDPNYASGTFSYSFAIYAATPTVTVTGGPFTYNGQGQAATATAVGIDGVTPLPGTASFTYNGSSSTPLHPGTYLVVATFTPTDPNYSSSSANGTLVISKATPVFSKLASPAVNQGATTVTISGSIAAGSAAPRGDDVAITLNGVTLPATVSGGGDSGGGNFSATFNIAGLGTGTYPITYTYLGDAVDFNAASAGAGTLTVQAAPSIVTSPMSQTVVSGSSVTLSATATGYPAPTVQWQQSTNGTNWSNLSGATSSSYTISGVTNSQNGYQYRAVFRNTVGSATTAAATLTVQYAPTVTRNPANATVNAGQTATFTAAASGNPAPAVQWQVSTNGGTTWTSISGATGTTLTLTNVTASQNAYRYRAVFTNTLGTATTSSATLTVLYAPSIATNPVSKTVTHGQSVTFIAAATGNPTPKVQWQVSTDGGVTWTNISGATSTTYTISSSTTSQNGYRYRAAFTNSVGSATTGAAILTVL